MEGKLQALHTQVQRGTYRAQPVKRRFISRPDGSGRALGVTALEDKIILRAVAMVLRAIYEQHFVGFSHGFKPGRSQHDAHDALSVGIGAARVNWIHDADIGSCLRQDRPATADPIPGAPDQRQARPASCVLRLVRKWLKAGVLDVGVWSISETGTPQGAVIIVPGSRSGPIGAKADYIVAGFEVESDARRFGDAMRLRFGQFALELHEDKIWLPEFGRFVQSGRKRRGSGKPETSTFLGFIFICGQSRRGAFQLHTKTRGDRTRARLQEVKTRLRERMHDTLPEQGQWLRAVVTDYFAYDEDCCVLAAPRIQHSWPDKRLPSNTRGGSRVRDLRTLGSVRGAASPAPAGQRPA